MSETPPDAPSKQLVLVNDNEDGCDAHYGQEPGETLAKVMLRLTALMNTNIGSNRKRVVIRRTSQTGTVRKEGELIGRNDPCPCGSEKKYKQCCLRKET